MKFLIQTLIVILVELGIIYGFTFFVEMSFVDLWFFIGIAFTAITFFFSSTESQEAGQRQDQLLSRTGIMPTSYAAKKYRINPLTIGSIIVTISGLIFTLVYFS